MAFIDVLILTQIGQNLGLGHFKRMKILENFLNNNSITSKLLTFQEIEEKIIKKSQVIILDAREIELNLINYLISKNKKLISLDDLETSKPYLISVMSLPYTKTFGPNPNFEGYEYLILNPILNNVQKTEELDILITFGGEDPNNLTIKFLKNFSEILKDKKVGILIGELFKNKEEIKNICILKGIQLYQNVPAYKVISKSKTIVTSFGMTLYESLTLGKNVILFNASEYHHNLFRNSNLEEKYNVLEIAFCKGSEIVITRDIKNINFKNNENTFKIDITQNLNRWKELIERVFNIKENIDKTFGSVSINRFTDKTEFYKNGKTILINF